MDLVQVTLAFGLAPESRIAIWAGKSRSSVQRHRYFEEVHRIRWCRLSAREDVWTRSKEQAEKRARRICLEVCEKAVHADASLVACMIHLTNGIVPRRSQVRGYLALQLLSDDSERVGLHEFLPMRDESAGMLQIVLAKHITQLRIP
jgi:hypothetical protein